MKIKAKANGNVIEAHEDAAKELIAAGIYEETNEPLSSEASTAVKPMGTDDFVQPAKAKVPAKGHRSK